MLLQQALDEWKAKKRRMDCVAATHWLCKRVPGFKPHRVTYYTASGDLYQHVVASDGTREIDLSPYANGPEEKTPQGTKRACPTTVFSLDRKWQRYAYRLEDAEGHGPFFGDQACNVHLTPHYEPADLFKHMRYPAKALDLFSDAGFVFGWQTQALYRDFFKTGGEAACRKLGFERKVYRPSLALCLPDGQVLFARDEDDVPARETFAQLLEAMRIKRT